MDKHEMEYAIEQIKDLIKKKRYKEACQIADDINWRRVKDWSYLSVAIVAYREVGDIESARDMAILAYNRNLGGKKLVYELVKILTRLKDFGEADQLYLEYEKLAPRDPDRFVLFYELRKAEGAPNSELIDILEDYRAIEEDVRYMYELAKLYSKVNKPRECVKLCDDIALLFQEGVYVNKALKMKQFHKAPLTEKQKNILERAKERKEDMDLTRELMYLKQMDTSRLEAVKDKELEESASQETAAAGSAIAADDKDYAEFESEVDENGVNRNLKAFILAKVREADEIKAGQTGAIPVVDSQTEQPPVANVTGETYEATAEIAPTANDAAEGTSSLGQSTESLKEIIANAKKKLDSSYDRISRENEEERAREEREEAVKQMKAREDAMVIPAVEEPSFGIYDTQNIQNQLAMNISEYIDDAADSFRPNPIRAEEAKVEEEKVEDDQQIEGQMSLADWIEAVREEKYGSQHTRQFSKVELERELNEREEKSAMLDKLLAESKKNKQSAASMSAAQPEMIRGQEMVLSAKSDLAARTGKASQKLEEAIDNLKIAAAESSAVPAASVEEEPVKTAPEDERTEISLDTAKIEAVSDKILKEFVAKELAEQSQAKQIEADTVKAAENTSEAMAEPQTKKSETPTMLRPQRTARKASETEAAGDKKLSGELLKIFRKYKEMPGLESQLAEYFETIDKDMAINTSSFGNIIISGNSSSDKTELAKTIVRAINYLYPDAPKKIAKTTGDSINQRGIVKSLPKLRGNIFIIEDAGVIYPNRVQELLMCLEQDTDRLIVIMEDSDAEINVLLNNNPAIADKFNHRIVLKKYTVNELVDMAKKYARKRMYEIDDDGLLELYLSIDQLYAASDNILLDDVRDIINNAIAHAEKRAAKKFFGGVKKRHLEDGDYTILNESDFKS